MRCPECGLECSSEDCSLYPKSLFPDSASVRKLVMWTAPAFLLAYWLKFLWVLVVTSIPLLICAPVVYLLLRWHGMGNVAFRRDGIVFYSSRRETLRIDWSDVTDILCLGSARRGWMVVVRTKTAPRNRGFLCGKVKEDVDELVRRARMLWTAGTSPS